MPRDAWTNNSGTWQKVVKMWTNNNGDWREIVKAWTNINGVWRQWWPPEGGTDPGPGPGRYVLSPTSIFLNTAGVGYAEFDTTQYRGSITEIYARLSWTTTSLVNTTISCRGRPSNTFYRNIDNDNKEWNGRTISHRIDSFSATSLTQFNAGTAIGFNLDLTSDPNFLSTVISNVQLELVIV